MHSHQLVGDVLRAVPLMASGVAPALLGTNSYFFTSEKAWMSPALIINALSLHQILLFKEVRVDALHRQVSSDPQTPPAPYLLSGYQLSSVTPPPSHVKTYTLQIGREAQR